MGFKKQHKGNLSEDLYEMRKKFREFDSILEDIQKYFYKIEKRIEEKK